MRISAIVLSALTFSAALIVAETAEAATPKVTQLRTTIRVDKRNGRLVRQFQSPRHATLPRQDLARIDSLIEQVARRHTLDPNLVRSVVRVESNYDPVAVSPKGALGLMQLMPGTARLLGVGNVFDPEENLDGGVRHLKALLETYDGNLDFALAAYNAGAGAVDRHNGIPPYQETRDYVTRIQSLYQPAKEFSAAEPALVSENDVRPVEQFIGPDGRIHLVTR